jgi:CheY-like chemotaxis protein
MKILLIDDDSHMRGAISELLEQKGYEVIQAENGKIALDSLAVYKFDLIITDIIMPELEGIEFILRLRQSKIPIISISGMPKEVVINELIQSLGIKGFLKKPFSKEDLFEIIDQSQN